MTHQNNIKGRRLLCNDCGVHYWENKKYKHCSSFLHLQKLHNKLNGYKHYDKKINKDVFIVNVDFW
jgi:hypothetical protein